LVDANATPKRRKRGAPTKDERRAKEIDERRSELKHERELRRLEREEWCDRAEDYRAEVSFLLQTVTGILAARSGEHWMLSQDELEKMTLHSSILLAKWSPAWLEKYREELALLGTIGTYAFTRMAITAQMKAQATKSKEAHVETVTDHGGS
jgi:hypothetical protein